MGTPLLPADNLVMTTELRQIYQSIVLNWLSDPDPAYAGFFDRSPACSPLLYRQR